MSATIVGGDRLVGGLARLEPLAGAIFGSDLRRRGWLARKLERECVDAGASSLLLREPIGLADRVGLEQVAGYVLVGRSPSLGVLARGAGVGVLPALRGRGIGATLIDAACQRAASRGVTALEFLAEPERLGWYLRMGFEPVRSEWTLQAEATGERDEFTWASEAALVQRGACVWSWITEAWQRTPTSERGWLASTRSGVELRAWASREGRAVLIHRFELGEPARAREVAAIVDALNHVRAGLPRGTPVLLYPCAAQRPWSRALLDEGWTIAQRSWVVRRALG